jgi:hypothetical protein
MKQFMITVLAFLGLQAFAKDPDGKVSLTEDQLTKLKGNLGEKFTEQFVSALSKDPEGNTTSEKEVQEMFAALHSQLEASVKENLRIDAEKQQAQRELTAEKAAKDKLAGIITEKDGIIATLTKKPEADPDAEPVMKNNPKNWVPSGQDTHLFGENQPFFALDDAHGYNRRAYASLAARHGIEIFSPRAASSLDYSSLGSDLGEYYRIRKQDRVQSFLLSLPSLAAIFPLESGYQDQAVLVNMFLTDDFSQADSTALGSTFENVVKGGYKFEPETLTMYDVMFAHEFKQMKELEKSWIGYLNREGSSPMKWSFIEYILVETGKKLKNEQEQRRVRGVRKNPAANVAGTSLQASNGLLKFIKIQLAAFKMQAFNLGEWTPSTIASHVKNGTKLIPEVLRDSGRLVLYMSVDAFSDYNTNLETLFALNQDWKGGINYVKEYPNVKIVPIPGMAPSKRLIWTVDGNIALFEDKAGEMLNFNMEQQDWRLKVWSNWRESVWAYMVGRKYDSAAAMPGDYSTQMIFCNDVDEPSEFFVSMDANDTTPSVLNHSSLISVANSVATAITGIDDCAVGQEVILKCGNATNAITIAAAGNFSLITGAWTPAVGDKIYLKKRSDDKFIELKREAVTSTAIALTADDTTPDVASGTSFITVVNTVPTAFTTLDNAVTDTVYTIYGGSDTNAVTMANAGNFVLTAAMTLSAGTYITLEKAANGKFYEIARG